jgi:hypothetical protein
VRPNDRYRNLTRRIADLINLHDPIGLLALGAPLDEYDDIARTLAARTIHSVDSAQWLDVVWVTFKDAFGDSAGDRARYRDLADEIARTRRVR